MEKRRNCSLGAIPPLFHNIFVCLLLDVHVSAGTRFSLRDKRLIEISEFEITRVNCINIFLISPQNIYCGYSLAVPRQDPSTEYMRS